MHAMASKKIKRLALSICLALGSILPAGAEEFLPLSDVREGMHGYAKTVVHGTKIDTFDVDVLGIMKNKGSAGGDLVLVKVSGPLIDETGGIAQGMSGSPVYIDGKLLGAIAYGFPQSDGRIGMVTPISDMLRLWTIDSGEEKKESGTDRDLIPLATPLMASGYTPSGMEFLTDKMKDFNMVPYSAASAGVDEMPRPLEAGGAVSATLVTGDLKLGAVGTVTYVDKDHMVAFGHPFLDKGSSSYFMHNSYIFTVVPSRNIPFKLGSVGAEIGMVNEDRGSVLRLMSFFDKSPFIYAIPHGHSANKAVLDEPHDFFCFFSLGKLDLSVSSTAFCPDTGRFTDNCVPLMIKQDRHHPGSKTFSIHGLVIAAQDFFIPPPVKARRFAGERHLHSTIFFVKLSQCRTTPTRNIHTLITRHITVMFVI